MQDLRELNKGKHMLAKEMNCIYRNIQGHTRPDWTILDNTGPYWTIQDHMEPYGPNRTKRDCSVPYRTKTYHMGPSGQYGTIQDKPLMGLYRPYGTTWVHPGPYGNIPDHTGPNGTK